ncbi:MAG: hypothetical protein WCP21_18780, partial [Armatimonadota bacterium]
MMPRLNTLLVLILLLALATVACASEFEHYPQYRYASGLPGGTFGVDPDGHAGFDGVMQINIPVGYTPGAGNYVLAPSSGS